MIAWWPLEVAGNTVVSLAYFVIAALILIPLTRLHQLRSNKLGAATAAIFFSCAVGHGMNALHPFLSERSTMPGMGGGTATPYMSFWWMAVWHALTAVIAVYYVSLRGFYGALLEKAPMFDDLTERQRINELEAFQVEFAARAKAEAERDSYASMLDSVVKNSQAAIYVKDLDGRYLMANPSMLEIMGVEESAILGETDWVWNPDQAPVWREEDVLAQSEQRRSLEVEDSSGSRHYYDSIKFPLRNTEGKVYATCGISLDVTQEKRAAAAVVEARDAALAATAAKSTFLATMSHEIRTPMNAVIGMTDLLLDTKLDEQQHEFVTTVRTSGDALLSVINDVLDFSKIESGVLRLDRAPFELADSIERCLDLVSETARSKGLSLVCYVDETCPTQVVGDAPRLRQILINLLSNAVKFTAEGEVLLTAAVVPTSAGRLQLTVTVTDTGIGISAEGVRSLFKSFSQVDPSTTRKYGGTGLGLAISLRLAQAMDGEVRLESTPGHGSTFTLEIVLDPAPSPADSLSTATPAPRPLAGLTALLVDDHATNLRILTLQLTSLGLRCTPVASAAAALNLVDAADPYDVVIVDADLPQLDGDRLTATELASALQRRPGGLSTPLVLLSSEGSKLPPEGLFAATLAKPIKGKALRSTMTTVLKGQRGNQAAPPGSTAIIASTHPLHVLLAEDNLVNQRVALLMLTKLGHTVDVVGTGLAALEAVHARSYDVVLMDVQMPEMDGLEATRRIRHSMPARGQPCIIAMTANALVEDERACLEAGMQSYLTKPVRATELQAVLDEMVERTRATT